MTRLTRQWPALGALGGLVLLALPPLHAQTAAAPSAAAATATTSAPDDVIRLDRKSTRLNSSH